MCVACTYTEGTYFTSNGHSSDSCEYEECKPCPSGQIRFGCGTNDGVGGGTCAPCALELRPNHFYNGTCEEQVPCEDLPPCEVGTYRKFCGLGGSGRGICVPCTRKTDDQYFADHGGLLNACPVETCDNLVCDAGSIRKGNCGDNARRSNNDFTCDLCPTGEYCELHALQPQACGAQFTTHGRGAKSEDECVCKVNHFMNYVDPRYSHISQRSVLAYSSRRCDECSASYSCGDVGSALEILDFEPGHWRSHNLTTLVRQCFHPAFCTHNATTMSAVAEDATTAHRHLQSHEKFAPLFQRSDSSFWYVAAFAESSSVCRAHHTGPYCEICEPGFTMTLDGCEVLDCSGSLEVTLIFPCIFVFMLLVMALYSCRNRRIRALVDVAFEAGKEAGQEAGRDEEALQEGFMGKGEAVKDAFKGEAFNQAQETALNVTKCGKFEKSRKASKWVVKLRIIISLIQLITQLSTVFSIAYPPIYTQLLEYLSVISLDFIEMMPIGCISSIALNHYHYLLARTVLPLVILLISLLIKCCLLKIAARYKDKANARSRECEPTGTNWRRLHYKPDKGKELENDSLAKAFKKGQTKFEQEEWDQFGVQDLRMDHFIRISTGLKWERVDSRPIGGTELKNPGLVEELASRTEFTRNEWNGFHVQGLDSSHFIQSYGGYFVPAAYYGPVDEDADRLNRKGVAKEVQASLLMTVNFVLFYLLFPSNSAKIFATLQCETLDDHPERHSFLRIDFRVDCKTTFYTIMWWYAVVMIVIYPIGIPLTYIYIFYKNREKLRELQSLELRHVIASRQLDDKLRHKEAVRSRLSAAAMWKAALCWCSSCIMDGRTHEELREVERAIKTLKDKKEEETKKHEEEEDCVRAQLPDVAQKLILGYKLQTFYFELIECFRKLAIVCLPVFFQPPGSVSQLIFGLLICFTTFGCFTWFSPFKEHSDNHVAILCQVQVFFALLVSAGFKYSDDIRAEATNMDVLLLLLTGAPLVVAVVLEVYPFCLAVDLRASNEREEPTWEVSCGSTDDAAGALHEGEVLLQTSEVGAVDEVAGRRDASTHGSTSNPVKETQIDWVNHAFDLAERSDDEAI